MSCGCHGLAKGIFTSKGVNKSWDNIFLQRTNRSTYVTILNVPINDIGCQEFQQFCKITKRFKNLIYWHLAHRKLKPSHHNTWSVWWLFLYADALIFVPIFQTDDHRWFWRLLRIALYIVCYISWMKKKVIQNNKIKVGPLCNKLKKCESEGWTWDSVHMKWLPRVRFIPFPFRFIRHNILHFYSIFLIKIFSSYHITLCVGRVHINKLLKVYLKYHHGIDHAVQDKIIKKYLWGPVDWI